MLPDYDLVDVSRDGDIGGLSAFMYFFTVSLCIPSSRAIPRMDSPLRFAFCTAFHLAVCSGVGFLRRCVAVLRTLPAPSRPGGGDGMLGVVVGVQSRQFGRPFSAQTVGGLIDNG